MVKRELSSCGSAGWFSRRLPLSRVEPAVAVHEKLCWCSARLPCSVVGGAISQLPSTRFLRRDHIDHPH